MVVYVICLLCMEIEDPQEPRVCREIPVIVYPLGVEVQLDSIALKDLEVLLERLVIWDLLEHMVELEHVVFYAFARGEKDDKGDIGGVGQEGSIGPQGCTGPRGSQGAAGIAGPKGNKGDRAVDIDIVAELCKHLSVEMVEQYRRGAYARYAINSMKDIELHDADHIKSIIDKGGRCNATQSDIARMASLSQTQVNSNYVLHFHNYAYNMDADMVDFHYFCVFLVYRIKAYAKIKHWERNYLISN